MIRKLTLPDVSRALEGAPAVLLALDVDGTLCRIARSPDLVYLPEDVRATLRSLEAAPGVRVAIVSGRSLPDAESLVGLPLIYAGNHGFEIRGGGIDFEHPVALRLSGALEEACGRLERAVAKWRGAWVERKRLTATVHFRNVAADQQHCVAREVRRTVTSYGEMFALRAGKRALEVRPRIDWHKGFAVEYIQERLGWEGCVRVCIGDDVTDEAMFRAFPDDLTIRVGWHAGSAARFYVDDPAEVHRVLEHVAASRRAPERAGAEAAILSLAAT